MPLSIGASNAQKSDNAASSTFTFDTSGVLSGDLIIMLVDYRHDFDVMTASPTVDTVHVHTNKNPGSAGPWQYIASVIATGAAPTLTFTFGSGLPYYAQMIAIRGGAVISSTAEDSSVWAGATPSVPTISASDTEMILLLFDGLDGTSIPTVAAEPTGFTRILETKNAALVYIGHIIESTYQIYSGPGSTAGLTWTVNFMASPAAYRFAFRIALSPTGIPTTWTDVTIPAKVMPSTVEVEHRSLQYNPAIYTSGRLSPQGVWVTRSASSAAALTALKSAYDAANP